MAIEDSASSGDAFTFERHGDLTVITATEAIERIDFGLEEQVADMILKPLASPGKPVDRFRPEPRREFRIDVSGTLDSMLEAGTFAGWIDGALGRDGADAGIAARDCARYGLADL